MRGQFALEQGQETAVRGDGGNAVGYQVGRSVQERLQQTLRLVKHDAVGTGAAHNPILHREWPSQCITHVARNTGEAGIQHQDAYRGPIDRLSAACHRHARSLPNSKAA